MGGSAQGAYDPQRCNTSGPVSLDPPFACSHTFIATSKTKRWVATRCCARSYVSHWYAAGYGRDGFRTWGPDGDADCQFHGRRGPVRVREVVCRHHRIVVFVRSVGPPTRVTFSFEVDRVYAPGRGLGA